jgi:anhydro-N-acetylmuramic acid kinase
MLAIGLMSGTSLDGIDAALIEGDGVRVAACLGGVTLPYESAFRNRIRNCLGARARSAEIALVEEELTALHAEAVARLILDAKPEQPVDLIGFHGHTLYHDPANGFTWQLGDGALLAEKTGIDVIADFRSADVAAGGEGAPLAPAYHLARAADLEKPLAVLNLGGVANVTFIGADGSLLAFDTGPANAMLDDWIGSHTGDRFDKGGAIAASGRVEHAALSVLLGHDYFRRTPPKSLDRDAFDAGAVAGLSVADGAATLAAFTVRCVELALVHLPRRPTRWLVTGGGRRNDFLMASLESALAVPVVPVEAVGWNGDLLEAEAFAHLAIRSTQGLPLSWPGTTGVPQPMTGGRAFSRG